MKQRITKLLSSLPLWQVDALGAVVVCLMAGVWYLAGLRPLSLARAERDEMGKRLMAQQLVAQDAAKLAATQEASLRRVREEIESSSIRLLPAEKINERVSELSGAAAKAGLRVDEIKPQQLVALPRFTTVPIRISGGGDYAAITALLRALRGEFRDTGVTGFHVVVHDEAAVSELRFALDLVWYAAPAKPTVKK